MACVQRNVYVAPNNFRSTFALKASYNEHKTTYINENKLLTHQKTCLGIYPRESMKVASVVSLLQYSSRQLLCPFVTSKCFCKSTVVPAPFHISKPFPLIILRPLTAFKTHVYLTPPINLPTSYIGVTVSLIILSTNLYRM